MKFNFSHRLKCHPNIYKGAEGRIVALGVKRWNIKQQAVSIPATPTP